jgi:hypothetical protein
MRIVMPNGTTKSFREGTPRSVIRRAQADMLEEMKASGAYEDFDFKAAEAALKPKRKVEVTQYSAIPPEQTPGAAAIPGVEGLLAALPNTRPGFNSAYTPERIAAVLYNEGASFRGDPGQLQDGFDNMANVIVNRERAGWKDKFGKGGAMASDVLTDQTKAAIAKGCKTSIPARDGSGRECLGGVSPDPTNGAPYFWHPNLSRPERTPKPTWAIDRSTLNGPFTSPATDSNDTINIETYYKPGSGNGKR